MEAINILGNSGSTSQKNFVLGVRFWLIFSLANVQIYSNMFVLKAKHNLLNYKSWYLKSKHPKVTKICTKKLSSLLKPDLPRWIMNKQTKFSGGLKVQNYFTTNCVRNTAIILRWYEEPNLDYV